VRIDLAGEPPTVGIGIPTAEFLCIEEKGNVWPASGRSWHTFEACLETASGPAATSSIGTDHAWHADQRRVSHARGPDIDVLVFAIGFGLDLHE
jgi:hypothetical protein